MKNCVSCLVCSISKDPAWPEFFARVNGSSFPEVVIPSTWINLVTFPPGRPQAVFLFHSGPSDKLPICVTTYKPDIVAVMEEHEQCTFSYDFRNVFDPTFNYSALVNNILTKWLPELALGLVSGTPIPPYALGSLRIKDRLQFSPAPLLCVTGLHDSCSLSLLYKILSEPNLQLFSAVWNKIDPSNTLYYLVLHLPDCYDQAVAQKLQSTLKLALPKIHSSFSKKEINLVATGTDKSHELFYSASKCVCLIFLHLFDRCHFKQFTGTTITVNSVTMCATLPSNVTLLEPVGKCFFFIFSLFFVCINLLFHFFFPLFFF